MAAPNEPNPKNPAQLAALVSEELVMQRTLTGNWRLRSKVRVWGRPWVVVEVEERVKGRPVSWLPYYVRKMVWRPATAREVAELCVTS